MYQMILTGKTQMKAQNQIQHAPGFPSRKQKTAEALLRQTQKEFNPETMQQIYDLPVSEYFTPLASGKRDNLPPET